MQRGLSLLRHLRGTTKGRTYGVIPFLPYGKHPQENLTLGKLFAGLSA